ncbi:MULTISPECIES: hypothetical protein [unclassified Enterococcus]|uniref:hypothetical protein n=1 Tax=unclassified Enterococcus TaxID=2608891 RepID=UPI0013EBD612|nr:MULTISPECIES: hypothetical protein [unclassified Enterococcus]
MDFKHNYPKLADLLTKRVDISRKEQQQSRWHWLTLILFGLLTVATFSQQLILVTLFIAVVAVIKGPVMIFWGMLYSFLVGLFPPIGILLSAIFFLLNIGTFTKNWRMTLVGIYFYFYPVGVMILRQFVHWDNVWFSAGALLLGLVLLHVMLTKLYQRYGIGRTIFWYVFSIPFALLTALLPSRLKTKLKVYHKNN